RRLGVVDDAQGRPVAGSAAGERRGNLRFGGAVGWCGDGHGTPFVAILRKGLKAANVMGVPCPAPNGCSRITFILAALPHLPTTTRPYPFGRIGRLRNQGRVQCSSGPFWPRRRPSSS